MSLIGRKSPLSELEHQAMEASQALQKEESRQKGKTDTMTKQPSLDTMIKQNLDSEEALDAAETPTMETKENLVYESVGQYDGADLSRSNAIKRAVARPKATSKLHRSNAIHHPTKASPIRRSEH